MPELSNLSILKFVSYVFYSLTSEQEGSLFPIPVSTKAFTMQPTTISPNPYSCWTLICADPKRLQKKKWVFLVSSVFLNFFCGMANGQTVSVCFSVSVSHFICCSFCSFPLKNVTNFVRFVTIFFFCLLLIPGSFISRVKLKLFWRVSWACFGFILVQRGRLEHSAAFAKETKKPWEVVPKCTSVYVCLGRVRPTAESPGGLAQFCRSFSKNYHQKQVFLKALCGRKSKTRAELGWISLLEIDERPE